MKAVLLVTHGLSLNTRLDIKHFPAGLEGGKKSNILNSWVYQAKHTTTSPMSQPQTGYFQIGWCHAF